MKKLNPKLFDGKGIADCVGQRCHAYYMKELVLNPVKQIKENGQDITVCVPVQTENFKESLKKIGIAGVSWANPIKVATVDLVDYL